MRKEQGKESVRPLRTCAVCRVQVPQELLDRYTLEDGKLRKDPDRAQSGRGAYAHPEHDPSDPRVGERIVRSLDKRKRNA